MSSDAATADPDLAEALANAERRRAMLQQLAQIGMHLAMQIDAHAAAAMAAIYEVKSGDPARPFATISRTVRLTLALEARVDAQILAFRKGKLPAGWGMGDGVRLQGRRQIAAERPAHREDGERLRPSREGLVDAEDYDEIDAFDLDAEFDELEFGGLEDQIGTIGSDLEFEPAATPAPTSSGVAVRLGPAASAHKCEIGLLRRPSARGERRLE